MIFVDIYLLRDYCKVYVRRLLYQNNTLNGDGQTDGRTEIKRQEKTKKGHFIRPCYIILKQCQQTSVSLANKKWRRRQHSFYIISSED